MKNSKDLKGNILYIAYYKENPNMTKLPNDIFEYISIDDYSATPKYKQLANSVITVIEEGKVKKGDLLPSINEVSFVLEVSRDTAEKGYRYLREKAIIDSVPGKGYFVSDVDIKSNRQVVLLFNKLSAHKKIIYDSFIREIGEDATVDLYVYNNDLTLFKRTLENLKKDYSNYVIIPHFIEGRDEVYEIVNTIPKEKLLLLDKLIPGVAGKYAAVYENFEKDIYNALDQARARLSKYHTLKLVFPDKSYYPKGIIKGFYKFCQQYAFEHLLVSDVLSENMSRGEVYINLMEGDLVKILDRVLENKMTVGKDIGIISYNETPLKKFILEGITTISTDFNVMGKSAARMIVDGSKRHEEVPFRLILRGSL
ncbi:MAG TPA: substrate-binding domain-containing protein [Sphingobacterium sp.]|nr:substrate-binding domain-containing protein [Sphingobacterium sp.]